MKHLEELQNRIWNMGWYGGQCKLSITLTAEFEGFYGRASEDWEKQVLSFLQYGRDQGANIVNGMPWHFHIEGCPVSHENDSKYLIQTPTEKLIMTPNDWIVTGKEGQLSVMSKKQFEAAYPSGPF